MGAAVAVADFDRDGWQDFYVTNSGEGSQNHLYRNQGDGTFTDVAGALGVADVNQRRHRRVDGRGLGRLRQRRLRGSVSLQVRPSRAVSQRSGQRLHARSASKAGLPRWVNANSAIWLDYDRDGRLDLFLAGYWSEDVDLWNLKTTRIMPESFEYAENGGRKYLFHNRGDGTFEEVVGDGWASTLAPMDARRGSGGPVGNGLSRSVSRQRLRHLAAVSPTSSGKRFVEVGARDRRAPHAQERDERRLRRRLQRRPTVDLQDEHLRARRARAGQRSLGAEEEAGAAARSTRISPRAWASISAAGAGARSSAILNNDGTLDLYLTNGYVSAGERSSYWYDFAQIAVGHSTIIGDAKNWPAMKGRSLSGYQRKRVWINDGARPVHRRRAGRRRHRHLRRPRGRARRSLESRRARRHRRQPARPAADLQEHGAAGPALDRVRARRHARATGARSARASSCTGTVRCRCRRSAAAAASARRTNGGSTTDSARPRRVDRVVDPLAVRPGRRSRAAIDRSHDQESD